MFVRILKQFRDCVRDGHLVVTQHAFEEMIDDNLFQRDVENCIFFGEIIERQWDSERDEWKYIILGQSADGQAIEGVLKPGKSGNAVVITTYLIMNQGNPELLICDICGEKKARLVKRPQVFGRGKHMLLVDNVPVIACKNCGESYMTSKTMHTLDKLRSKRPAKEPERKIGVAEFV